MLGGSRRPSNFAIESRTELKNPEQKTGNLERQLFEMRSADGPADAGSLNLLIINSQEPFNKMTDAKSFVDYRRAKDLSGMVGLNLDAGLTQAYDAGSKKGKNRRQVDRYW